MIADRRVARAARLRHGAATDAGRVRIGNEDAFDVDLADGLFVVADGLGGHQAGELASTTAVASFVAAIRDAGPMADDERDRGLRSAVAAAHHAVETVALRRPECRGMGTTLVAAWIPMAGRMWVVNVGDSRCYLKRGSRLTQLSLDHSAIEALRRAGRLPADRMAWPPRAQLTQALGLEDALRPHVARTELEPQDRILLCSDGLTDMLTHTEIARVLEMCADPQEACDRLIQEADWRGGLDNTTVVIVDVMPGSGALD